MNLNDFQAQCEETDLMPGNTLYHLLGAASEVGEIIEYFYTCNNEVDDYLDDFNEISKKLGKIKKQMRDEGREIKGEYLIETPAVVSEALDLLWYSVSILSSLGISLEQGAALLREKLFSRKERGVLHGSGDKR